MAYAVQVQHLRIFGAIIQYFARLELLMTSIVAQLLQISMTDSMIMMAGVGYAAKRAALLSILENHDVPLDRKTKIIKFLDEFHKHNNLRNNIAHNSWLEGRRPNSIKPGLVIVRGGKGRFIGVEDNEPDMTFEDFSVAMCELGNLYNAFLDYLEPIGLLTPIEADEDAPKRTRKSSSTSSERGGPPTKKSKRVAHSSKAKRPA
jgi:hypothetical protein